MLAFEYLLEFETLVLLACHKKNYLICVKFLKYYVTFIYFQTAVSALLAVSVYYFEKNQNKYYIIFRKLFENSTHIK